MNILELANQFPALTTLACIIAALLVGICVEWYLEAKTRYDNAKNLERFTIEEIKNGTADKYIGKK